MQKQIKRVHYLSDDFKLYLKLNPKARKEFTKALKQSYLMGYDEGYSFGVKSTTDNYEAEKKRKDQRSAFFNTNW